MRRIAVLGLLMLFLSACSATTTQCLQTPETSKVPAQALSLCEEALKGDLARQDVFHKVVGLLRARGRYDEMARWSQRVLEHDATRSDALYQLAFALRKTGDCKAALPKYLAYAETNPDDPDPYFGMGLCYVDLGDTQGAIRVFERYLEKEKRETQMEWVEKAKSHLASLRAGEQMQAPRVGAAAARDARDLHRGSPPAAPPPPVSAAAPPAVSPPPPVSVPPAAPAPTAAPAPAAAAPTAPKTIDCAAASRTVAADPFATSAYEQLAECAARAGRHSEVIARMRTALRDNPDWARGYLHLGRAFRATGDEPQAKSALAKACSAGVAEACGL